MTFEYTPNATTGICRPSLRIMCVRSLLQHKGYSYRISLEYARPHYGHHRAKTHFLLVTLHRSSSVNPRTIYSLVDAVVLPLSLLEDTFSIFGNFEDSSPVSVKSMLAKDEERRKRDGALGSVMVMSIELPKGDNRSPCDALKKVFRFLFFMNFPSKHPAKQLILSMSRQLPLHILQPLGLFQVHKVSISYGEHPRLSLPEPL
jgi:hypothetical protein